MEINNKLKNYIENNIFPEYKLNDSGHQLDHINYVINRSLEFSKQFPNINLDMLYTAAAFHDIAHHIDSKKHEELSAKAFYENEDMKQFFTDQERLIIKEAIEDHRASSNHIPRNDYGKIISSADRNVSIDELIKRVHSYTLAHFPNYTEEKMIKRAYEHISDKFGDYGYAKSYVVDEEFEKFKKDVSNLLKDKELFKKTYLEITKY